MDSLIQIAAALPELFNLLGELEGQIHIGLAGLGAGRLAQHHPVEAARAQVHQRSARG